MIEIGLFIALIGSAIAGLWDLITTEVPDEIPALMIVLSIANWFVYGSSTGDFYPLFSSLVIGTVVLAIGLLMYQKNQWGEADAWILAAIFYAIPVYKGLFIVEYLPNLLIVSTIYLIIYSVILGLLNKKIVKFYLEDLYKNKLVILSSTVGVLILYFIFSYYQRPFTYEFIFLLLFFIYFWRYARVIENSLFKKRISVKDLKVGDVLISTKWVGLTEAEVEKLKKTRKTVEIKEGVRFVPVFFLTLTVTILYGSLLLSIILLP